MSIKIPENEITYDAQRVDRYLTELIAKHRAEFEERLKPLYAELEKVRAIHKPSAMWIMTEEARALGLL